jgi:hypothetical protein
MMRRSIGSYLLDISKLIFAGVVFEYSFKDRGGLVDICINKWYYCNGNFCNYRIFIDSDGVKNGSINAFLHHLS